jgi:hypothetical protein
VLLFFIVEVIIGRDNPRTMQQSGISTGEVDKTPIAFHAAVWGIGDAIDGGNAGQSGSYEERF